MSNYIEYNGKIAFHPGHHAKEFKYPGSRRAKLINRYSNEIISDVRDQC